MSCTGCGTGAVSVGASAPSFLISSGSGRVGPVNPLTGLPLRTGEVLVSGPPFTGPRQTVVNRALPNQWPPWIENVMGEPVDRGTRAGGTWDGPQMLEEITVSGRAAPWLLLGLLALGLWGLSQ